jgi:hypothetical protein
MMRLPVHADDRNSLLNIKSNLEAKGQQKSGGGNRFLAGLVGALMVSSSYPHFRRIYFSLKLILRQNSTPLHVGLRFHR